ncbi:mitochondrial ribonuclease P catalytic subunit [Macrosteles quadrilineatus]|uniref:mitochondrial ribonuclease P catalytic subunit n=1 Tax=Macrosteles quadrilineatus TaxID=74068 RepID=UPI0023E23552|nr:mitochondrial ribonuclease P catalytic subunit [Macrosteles quadrilineatus]
MKHFMRFRINQCAIVNIYHENSATLRGLLATTNCESGSPASLKYRIDKARNISSYGNGCWNGLSNRRLSLHSNVESDDEDKLDDNGKDSFFNEYYKQEDVLLSNLQSVRNNAADMSTQKWDALRNSLLKLSGKINAKNIDAVILNKCSDIQSLPLGKSYFKYLKSLNTPINRACYGSYLRLFHQCASDCSSDDLNEILIVYKELSEVYPLLDYSTAEKAVLGLCVTENWKEYEKLFVAIKQFYNPSVSTYKVVILTSFDKGDFEVGWKLMEEMQYQGCNVPDEVFLHWFQKVRFRRQNEDITRVLNFFNYFNVKPSDMVCKIIKDAFEEYNEKAIATFTKVKRDGVCLSCNSLLEPCQISKEDFLELRKAFLNPVIIGKDIFQKTKPEEFSEFLNFLEQSGPFNIVVDGLNVALHGRHQTTAINTERLKTVVKYFAGWKQKVLVLGRKHMASWNTPDMEFVKKNAQLFLADNLSQDDPFMLYAALHGGLDTYFVSRDMMRGHKFLLSDKKLRNTFQKWQSLRQLFILTVDRGGNLIFQEPVSFLQTIQQNSHGDWHVPYTVLGEELTNRDRVDHLHRHWLCLQKVAKHNPSKVKRPSFAPEKVREVERPYKQSVKRFSVKNVFKED